MAFPYVNGCHVVCDLGAGAGFPSIPLKIVRPSITFTLLESRQKMAAFLNTVVDELKLTDIAVTHERAERYYGRTFDVVLIRAAGKIKKLVKTIDHLMAPTGSAIFYKSHDIGDELRMAEPFLVKQKFHVRVEKLWTPIENLPLALVIVYRT
jgi:16S rRNA (guanine527-N7)-methyltransferase